MWLIDFNIGKTQFNQSNNTGAIDVEIDGSVKMLGLSFSSKLD